MARLAKPVASEDQVQITIMQWAQLVKHKGRPLADYLIHTPNGGDIGSKKGAKLKKMGVKAGYPDLSLDIAKGKYYGLRIELKRKIGGKVRDNQVERLAMLNDEGYYAVVCKGFQEATQTIRAYINLKEGEGFEN